VIPAAPAGFTVRPQWAVEFLESELPGVVVPSPRPVVRQKSLPQGTEVHRGRHQINVPRFPRESPVSQW